MKMIEDTELKGMLDFLRAADRLKDTTRTSWTSRGAQESVAAHTWRLCLMAMLFAREFPGIDVAKLLRICIVHDLGEAVSGDISAKLQEGQPPKAEQERADLLQLAAPLPVPMREEIIGLWEEYEAANSPEAKLAKALDKLETIMQHNQGDNPEDFDYRFNLQYGRQHTVGSALIERVREILDRETEERASS